MNHISRILTGIALTLVISIEAQATLERIEEAFELDLTQVTLPRHEAGRVVIRQCSACQAVVLRVDENTTYHIGHRRNAVPLQDLIEAAASTTRRKEALLYVMYSTVSGVVTRITLSREWAITGVALERN